MTNGDRIRAMSDDELADFLNDNFQVENVAEEWFGNKYCNDCEVHQGITEHGSKIDFHDCETDAGCPHGVFNQMKKWLESETE